MEHFGSCFSIPLLAHSKKPITDLILELSLGLGFDLALMRFIKLWNQARQSRLQPLTSSNMELDNSVPVRATLMATCVFFVHSLASVLSTVFLLGSNLDITTFTIYFGVAFRSVLPSLHLTILLVATIKYQKKISPSVQPPINLQCHNEGSKCSVLELFEELKDEPEILSPKNLMKHQRSNASI